MREEKPQHQKRKINDHNKKNNNYHNVQNPSRTVHVKLNSDAK